MKKKPTVREMAERMMEGVMSRFTSAEKLVVALADSRFPDAQSSVGKALGHPRDWFVSEGPEEVKTLEFGANSKSFYLPRYSAARGWCWHYTGTVK